MAVRRSCATPADRALVARAGEFFPVHETMPAVETPAMQDRPGDEQRPGAGLAVRHDEAVTEARAQADGHITCAAFEGDEVIQIVVPRAAAGLIAPHDFQIATEQDDAAVEPRGIMQRAIVIRSEEHT